MGQWSVTSAELTEICARNSTIAGVLRELGVDHRNSGNYRALRSLAFKLGVELPQWTDMPPVRRGVSYHRIPDELFFSYGQLRHGSSLKRRMIDRGVPDRCSVAGCPLSETNMWCGRPVSYQVDHIDGDTLNNRFDNLRLMCPTCHSQTATYGNKKRYDCDCGLKKSSPDMDCPHGRAGIVVKSHCSSCGSEKSLNSGLCRSCSNRSRVQKKKIEWPDIDELMDMLNASNFTQVADKLGVSDNAIRKHIRKMEREVPKRLNKKRNDSASSR